MKQTKTKLLCLLFAVLMLLSLTACGKDKETDPGVIKLGDYELLYKGACIMEDANGKDAIVMTLDFTNNSKENASYLWTVNETVMQNGVELEAASVFTNYETFETVVENQFKEVAPGTTIEVKTAYVLSDTSSTVEATFEQLFGKKNGKITIDTSTLSREEAVGADSTEDGGLTTSAASDDALLDWWNGEWYGWWMMTGCTGNYESMEGQWWDVCGIIDIGADYTGTVTLWDEDYKKENPMVSATVSLNTAGTGENGTMTSEGGWFTDVALEHADWIVDPGLVERDNMIYIDGWYENGDDGYYYEIYLRPWGLRWDDAGEDYLPYLYDDWYLPLIDAGKSMPDSIEMDDSAGSSNTDAAITTSSANVPGGDGIVTEEQVQMGYVWMNKVNNNIFDTTYEEVVSYFGVEGEFVNEEYSDHMKANYRYYKWVSSENSSHFIYVNFKEETPGVYKVSAFNTSGFSGTEAMDKYLDIVKANAAEANKAAAANATMKDFSAVITMFAHDEVSVTIKTTIPDSGWSYDERGKCLVENEDPNAFGAGAIRFDVRENVEKFDFYKDDFEDYQDIEDRVIGGITFHGRTYKKIGYEWIEYIAQIDDNRALSIGLTDMDCVPGTMPDIILNNISIQ
ncbi:DUF5067 domain-containing protein [Hominifimenecus microfluidus]|uniref:DUF5067 domain-containing protein n=1 Tax=Hominifimenecus microfluidus TaxID=2885348 RepID=UPI0032BFAE39